jgi:hypothetical protein
MYTKTTVWVTGKKPYAHVSTKKNRIKEYDGCIYLEDNQEFEIELFNPYQQEVLAKIKLNGEYISGSGVVIRPGERVWLERYLDKNSKFKFSTYDVENTQESKEAVANNGLVEVEFFDKVSLYYKSYFTVNMPSVFNMPSWNNSGTWFNDGLFNISASGTVNNTSGVTNNTAGVNYSQNYSSDVKTKSFETGRVSEGSGSNQAFSNVNMEFESLPCSTSRIKILPLSTKHQFSKDLKVRQYCTGCGTKINASWKFCASCGEKM